MSEDIKSRKRLSQAVLDADTIKFSGIKRLAGRYTPARAEFSSAAIASADAETLAAQEAERDAVAALEAARDRARIAEHKRHDLLVGATEQVAAQFGKDSDEYQGLGLKKKAEYGK
jgi:hypothetical protein